jgi:PIN domain nuclease of toxin-antitoxin system
MKLDRKMSGTILDSSFILAHLNNEGISTDFTDLFQHSIISSVTYTETLSILLTRNLLTKPQACEILSSLIGKVISFDFQQAEIAAELDVINKQNKLGLSLADRACLALGLHMKLPIYTADKIWASIRFPDLKVNLIR